MLAFQHSLQLGQSLAVAGKIPAFAGIWVPFALFTGFGVWMFIGSRNRPGETPITHVVAEGAELVSRLRHMLGHRPAEVHP